jgi:hypothetical protein
MRVNTSSYTGGNSYPRTELREMIQTSTGSWRNVRGSLTAIECASVGCCLCSKASHATEVHVPILASAYSCVGDGLAESLK